MAGSDENVNVDKTNNSSETKSTNNSETTTADGEGGEGVGIDHRFIPVVVSLVPRPMRWNDHKDGVGKRRGGQENQLSNKKIVDVACGDHHTGKFLFFFFSSSSSFLFFSLLCISFFSSFIYYFFDAKFFLLFSSSPPLPSASFLFVFNFGHIQHKHIHTHTTVVITESGEVWAWGLNQAKQCTPLESLRNSNQSSTTAVDSNRRRSTGGTSDEQLWPCLLLRDGISVKCGPNTTAVMTR